MKNPDVVIVGAGIIGLSTAWQLARRARLRILVVDKAAGVGEGSTGASSAVCRFRYSHDEVVGLARDGIRAYQQWQAFTRLPQCRAGFHQEGVLWLTGTDAAWADAEYARMTRLGIACEVLDDTALAQRFPALGNCTLAPDLDTGKPHRCAGGGSHLFECDGGYVEPVAAAADLVEACRGRGVEVSFGQRVISVDSGGGQVRGIGLAGGEYVATPLLINAAGPWCQDLNQRAGIELGWQLMPVRIQVLYRDRPAVLSGHIPVTVDLAGGIYFRTQNRGQQLVVGSVRAEHERERVADPDHFAALADPDFEVTVLHALHHRLPALPYAGKVSSYCGLYTVNVDDVHPIVGPTALPGFWVANGFSGHGFKLAPAIGSLLAQAITGQSDDFDTHVTPAFLAVDRAPIALATKSVLA